MDRRDFLRRSLLGLAGAAVGSNVLTSLAEAKTAAPGKKDKKIGLQLYSLRDAMKKDPEATLKAIAAMGYSTLEAANYADGKMYGYAPAEFRKLVEGLGMSMSSCHIKNDISVTEKFDDSVAWWDKALDDQIAMGCRYAIQPVMKVGDKLDEIKKYCDYFNAIGEMANRKGIRFGFHNHAREFAVVEGEVVYDYLINNTSLASVFYEMDVYWVDKGGKSPVEYLNKYAGRFPVLHIKDEDIIGASGVLDFKAIFEAAYKQGMKDYYVEIEQYPQPAEICAARSFDYLNAAKFVK